MSELLKLKNSEYLSFTDTEVNYFEISGRDANSDSGGSKESFNEWGKKTLDVGDFKVLPFGSNNDIPKEIQDAVFPNHLANRLQNRKAELLVEQGPYLYKLKAEGNKYIREAVLDPEVIDWVKDDEWHQKLLHNATEYYYCQGVFTKIFNQRGMRIGNGGISQTENLSFADCRLAYKKNDKRKKPTHVVIGDWSSNSGEKEFDIYPLFDVRDPFKYPVSVHYASFKSFGVQHYAVPEVYSSLEWIRRSTSIPKVIKSLTDNSLNIKWHIQSPARFWTEKKEQLKSECKAKGIQYKEQMLEDLKKQILGAISKLLSGVENVGKFWHNEYLVEIMGGSSVEHGWKIEAIEQKVKDYVKAQLEIATKADNSTSAGLGLHGALANVGADGKSDSGNEQMTALKNHQLTSTPTPEFYVTKAYNDILRVKWPDKKLTVGFVRINVEREQDLTPNKRFQNQEQ